MQMMPIYEALVLELGNPYEPVSPAKPTSDQLRTMRKLASKRIKREKV